MCDSVQVCDCVCVIVCRCVTVCVIGTVPRPYSSSAGDVTQVILAVTALWNELQYVAEQLCVCQGTSPGTLVLCDNVLLLL